ncbi:MAG: hypothetical protein L6R40_007465 [Gallowayella cf. fulva]|nr:MAG: hypothetical protein L6R40_007465 [Xanthomendoza cf. fulva]
MSPTAPGASEEERKGLSKFVRRASKVFRRRSSARASISGPSDLPPTSSGATAADSSAAPVTSSPPIAENAIEEQPTAADPPEPAATQQVEEPKTTKPPNVRLAKTAADAGTILEEKARVLFAKYGLTLEPGEWTSPIKPDAERVEKKIRMRIHRACHHCQTTFGPDRICNNCQHTRCKKCPRYPSKKAKEPKGKSEAAGGVPATVRDRTLNLKSLAISSRATGKQIAYKPATQRVIPATATTAWPLGNGIRSGSMSDGRATNAPKRSETYREDVKGADTIVVTSARGSRQSGRKPNWIRRP